MNTPTIADLVHAYALTPDHPDDTTARDEFEFRFPYQIEVEHEGEWMPLDDTHPGGDIEITHGGAFVAWHGILPFGYPIRCATVAAALVAATDEATNPGGDWTAIRVVKDGEVVGQIAMASVDRIRSVLAEALGA